MGVSLAVGVGLVCAVLSALVTNLSFLWKLRGAVAAPDVDMRHPLQSVRDLFQSKWWTIGWGVAGVAFALHVAALTLAPISIGQAVLAGGLVFLAVFAERFFGFELGRRQWTGIVLVAVSLGLLTLTGGGGGKAHSHYSLAGMIIFESIAIGAGVLLVVSHAIERIPVQRGLLLGIAAGLGFGISDVAIKALSGDLADGPLGLVSPWAAIILIAAAGSFFASARSLQIGDGVAVIAVTSVAANLSTILAGLAVFGDPLGENALVVAGRIAAFAAILAGAALIPAPVRAGAAIDPPQRRCPRRRSRTSVGLQGRADPGRADGPQRPPSSPARPRPKTRPTDRTWGPPSGSDGDEANGRTPRTAVTACAPGIGAGAPRKPEPVGAVRRGEGHAGELLADGGLEPQRPDPRRRDRTRARGALADLVAIDDEHVGVA